jgi:3-(methylthio)propionyl---CoA ligase
MLGLMQDWPLLCHTLLDHAAVHHGEQEIVTRTAEGPIHRETYADAHLRARKIAQWLGRSGIELGDRIGTLAANTYRHLEVWYGAMGLGAIYHTINPRLFPEQIAYIVNHAEDALVFVDLPFVKTLEAIAPQLSTVKQFIVLTDRAHMPATSLRNAVPYEELIAELDGDFAWKRFDENTAAGLCYTSGTTGRPKGVLYSHRSNVIHTLAINVPDGLGLKGADVVLPIVPMYHANAWSIPFAAPAVGAKIAMPGVKLDGESVYQLLTSEKVTLAAAVPTVWLSLLQHLDKVGGKLPDLKRVVIGGAAPPRMLFEAFEARYGIEVCQGWGMTEMSPVGTFGSLNARDAARPLDQRLNIKAKQGRALYTVEMKIEDDAGRELPHDGAAFGHLKVRGPAIARGYFKGEGGEILDADGFFDTGDIATIDEGGYMQITDRAKDVIKSGGEWISSIEIENTAMGHPDVAEAAVIGVKHPKWDERPLLVIVLKDGAAPSKDSLLAYLNGRIAKWWMPDDVVFVKEIPHTATGKIQKRDLKAQFADYKLPTA